MSSLADVTLRTLTSYKNIAQSSVRRAALLKDEACVSFLVYVLDEENQEIVKTSVDILLLLSEKCSHRSVLRRVCGITQAISALQNKGVADKEVRCSIDNLFQRLTEQERKPLQDLHNSLESVALQSKALTERKDQHSFSKDSVVRNEHPFKKTGMKFISGGLSQRSKSMTFQLTGGSLTQESQTAIESALLNVRGILSIYFDLSRNRCIVRGKSEVRPETVACAILERELYSVEQVLKDENGEEILMAMGILNDESDAVESPEYLNESFGNSPHRETNPDKALVRTGEQTSRKDSSGGIWSNITSFLTNSFYW